MKLRNVLKAGVGLLLLPLVSCGSVNMDQLLAAGLTATQAMSISDAQMAQYAEASVAEMDAQNRVAPVTSKYTQRLNRLTSGLTSVNGTPLNFKVYETDEVNAFACPDGSVRVYTGLMDVMNDDELLGVIGHEIGHVACHHSRDAFKQQLMNGAIAQAIASAGGMGAVLSQSQLLQLGNSFASAKYSQKHELEADNFGYDFLKGAGRNPWGMISSFEKLEQLSGNTSSNSTIANMFSSHPQTSERIKKLTERAKKEGIAKPSE